jgi:hypothetical protein
VIPIVRMDERGATFASRAGEAGYDEWRTSMSSIDAMPWRSA